MTGGGYTALPAIYDRWQKSYGKDYSTLIAPRVFATLLRYNVPVSTFADLGCGTGALALMLARRGWRGFGVDASAGMIREANTKLTGGEGRVAFLQQDMRTLTIPERVRVVTSMFDVVNHLTTLRGLRSALSAVQRALIPGGLFIFDTNNERCFSTLWNRTETIRHRDFTVILRNSYIPGRHLARSHVTILPSASAGGSRTQEVVRERFFTRREMQSALNDGGFRILETRDFNFSEVKEFGRLKTWWVARKEREPAIRTPRTA